MAQFQLKVVEFDAMMHLASSGFTPEPPESRTWEQLGKSNERYIAPWWQTLVHYRSNLTELETNQFLSEIIAASRLGIRSLIEPLPDAGLAWMEAYYVSLENNSKRFIELLSVPHSRLYWQIMKPPEELRHLGWNLLVSNAALQ